MPESVCRDLFTGHPFVDERYIIFLRSPAEFLPVVILRDTMQIHTVRLSFQKLKCDSIQIDFIRIRDQYFYLTHISFTLTSSSNLARLTLSPSESGYNSIGVSVRPFNLVPFRLFRSLIKNPSPALDISAC